MSAITDGQGLNITLVGYLGKLHFGLVCCREFIPDIDTLATYLVEELELLVEAAGQPAAVTSSGIGSGNVPGPRVADGSKVGGVPGTP